MWRRELPADDAPGVRVDHEAKEHGALPAAQVREVSDPQLVRPLDRELAIDQIGARGGARVGFGGRHGFPRRFAPTRPSERISRAT